MEFQHEPGRYYKLDDNQRLIGDIKYSLIQDDSVISIDHTFVNPEFRGKGIARQLLQEVLDLAISNNQKVLPVCPYARMIFHKEPELQSLLSVKK